MKIDSTSYSLASSHLLATRDETQESLRAWTGNQRPDFEARAASPASVVALSAAARASLAANLDANRVAPPPAQLQKAPETSAIDDAFDAADKDPILGLIKAMLEFLTGESIRVFSAKDMKPAATAAQLAEPKAAGSSPPSHDAPPQRAGFGIEYDYHAVREEFEQTRVATAGTIRTADGRAISFTLDLSLSRRYREETSVSLRSGDAVRRDPLVLNFNGTAAQLADQSFRFDLLGNGQAANLPLLAGGNGYLAVDRNGNGTIDSGRELFGPSTNSGFGELAALDRDGNGWIDENDRAFESLRLWAPDGKGGGTLETLAQRGVGAIATGSVTSPFEVRGAGNRSLGAIAASGVFLDEDGTPGTVQEIDLNV